MFAWMAWTLPMAVFFSCIALMLVGHDGVGDRARRRGMRKGFLPMATTRGDRLFIGLLAAPTSTSAFVGLAGKIAEWFVARRRAQSIWISFVAVDAGAGA